MNNLFSQASFFAILVTISVNISAVAQELAQPQFGDESCVDNASNEARILAAREAEQSIKLSSSSSQQSDDYLKKVQAVLGLRTEAQASLQDLLDYLGYAYVKAEDLEALDPAVLNDSGWLKARVRDSQTLSGDELLAIRYMSPKIADVATTGVPKTLGWRKLIRIKTLKGSPAKFKDIASAWLLFNFFNDSLGFNDNPFKTHSVANQAILIKASPPLNPKTVINHKTYDQANTATNGNKFNAFMNNSPVGGTPTPISDAKLYWLAYGPLPQGKIQRFLPATFDAGSPTLPDGNLRRYNLPNACAECHGGLIKQTFYDCGETFALPSDTCGPSKTVRPTDRYDPDYRHAKLNFLDSDHWFDRIQLETKMQPNDDFAALFNSQSKVLFDLKRSNPTAQDSHLKNRSEEFEILKTLNKEIHEQNLKAENNPATCALKSASLRSLEKWQDLHPAWPKNGWDRLYAPPKERAISRAFNNDLQWEKENDRDQTLLGLLNRHCYRCHSSVVFNVFEKQAVYSLKPLMLELLNRDHNLHYDDECKKMDRIFRVDENHENTFCMPQDHALSKAERDKLAACLRALDEAPGGENYAECTKARVEQN